MHFIKFDELDRKDIIFPMVMGCIVFLLFVGFIVFQFATNRDISLKYEDSIDLKVTKVRSERGFLTLNDSIGVSSATPLIKEKSEMKILNSLKQTNLDSYNKFTMDFGQVVKPYRITKERNTDTIIVYHYSNTLYFKLFTD
nr:hypothetical protein [uncultured Allomuricauda sp.]